MCACAEMKKTLGWLQLMCLGIGAIIGAGIFVITGARQLSPGMHAVNTVCFSRPPNLHLGDAWLPALTASNEK